MVWIGTSLDIREDLRFSHVALEIKCFFLNMRLILVQWNVL